MTYLKEQDGIGSAILHSLNKIVSRYIWFELFSQICMIHMGSGSAAAVFSSSITLSTLTINESSGDFDCFLYNGLF